MVKYARCNAMLSLALDEKGEGCRFMAKADTEQAVVEQMSRHLAQVHDVDAKELTANIKGVIKTTSR
jgi:predicted small metal-binding protein